VHGRSIGRMGVQGGTSVHRRLVSSRGHSITDGRSRVCRLTGLTGLADPKLQARLADVGGTVLAGSPADFGKFIADETEKWGKVIKSAGIKPE